MKADVLQLAYLLFSQTWVHYVWLMAWQIHPSVCRLWRACTLLRGSNFSGIFLHHIIAWPSGKWQLTHQKSRRSSKEGSSTKIVLFNPPRGLIRKGDPLPVKQANPLSLLIYYTAGCDFSVYLFIISKPKSHVWLYHLLMSFLYVLYSSVYIFYLHFIQLLIYK